jgi:hypothetical protein
MDRILLCVYPVCIGYQIVVYTEQLFQVSSITCPDSSGALRAVPQFV